MELMQLIKIGILAALAFNSGLPTTNFYIEGIENIQSEDFAYANDFHFTVKHLAVAKLNDQEFGAKKSPCDAQQEF